MRGFSPGAAKRYSHHFRLIAYRHCSSGDSGSEVDLSTGWTQSPDPSHRNGPSTIYVSYSIKPPNSARHHLAHITKPRKATPQPITYPPPNALQPH
jgi:hypothetical protein